VNLIYPVQHGGAAFALPDRILPVLLDLPEDIPFYATPGDVATLVKRIVTALSDWRSRNHVPPDLLARARLEFEISLFSTLSETGIPIIHLDGLYLPCTSVTWA
jgi:hypothetical protein